MAYNTYNHGSNLNLVDREIRVRLLKLVADNASCRRDPFVIPVGVTEILQFVSWMQDC